MKELNYKSLDMDLLKRLLLILAIGGLMACSCEKKEEAIPIVDQNPFHQLLFYNVENLFDTIDHPQYADEEFTPAGEKEWNTEKYYDKLGKLSSVINEAQDGVWPVLIGLCEVENRAVLESLIFSDPLKMAGYEIVHKESPDFRGIDVALLYRSSLFELLDYKTWQVWFPFDTGYSTREVLYVTGKIADLEQIHIFVNHWPSRSAGEVETRPKRIFVAEMIRTKVDSILLTDGQANIIITGDFNDEPNDLSVISGLSAYTKFESPESKHLYAISHYLQTNSEIGSYKYKGNWNFLDQFVVSGALLDTANQVYCRPDDLGIVDLPYLFESDKTYMGRKPFRSFLGDYYHGGYSDHLPVYLNLRYKE